MKEQKHVKKLHKAVPKCFESLSHNTLIVTFVRLVQCKIISLTLTRQYRNRCPGSCGLRHFALACAYFSKLPTQCCGFSFVFSRVVSEAGLNIIEFPPPAGGGESKGLEMGKGKEGGKKRKKKIWGKYNFWQYQITKTD